MAEPILVTGGTGMLGPDGGCPAGRERGLGRALRQGGNLVPEHATGVITFEDYLAAHLEPAGLSCRGKY